MCILVDIYMPPNLPIEYKGLFYKPTNLSKFKRVTKWSGVMVHIIAHIVFSFLSFLLHFFPLSFQNSVINAHFILKKILAHMYWYFSLLSTQYNFSSPTDIFALPNDFLLGYGNK